MANDRGSMRDKMRRARRAAGTRKSTGSPRKGARPARKPAVGRRARPTARANATQRKINQRPMPKPPARRKPVAHPGASTAAATSAANAQLQATIDQLHTRFDRLESDAQLGDIYSAIGEIDSRLTELPFTLENLRERGYVHAGELEDLLEALDDKWDEIRPRVDTALRAQVRRLDSDMDQTERQLNRLRVTNQSAVKGAETAVSGLERQIRGAKTAVSGLYGGIDTELYKIDHEFSQVKTMLDLLDGSQEIRMQEAEGPLLAVASEWQQDGDDGPEGYLFLTDQRLLFEQREEVVTKRRFGIFKADSEMVQQLHIDVSVHDIESVQHKEEGGFLGMGKDDIIELVFAATAPLSRARFHLKGQDSDEWAAMIKRIQTGDIDEDRADDYVEEMETAAETAAAFPEKCPTCFADVPVQQRGVTSVTCEFCGTEITP
ncbi:MAG: hypothetical protein DWQ04_12150 [Chloroflexi bacterium]|nr:MAG: hypothetical protein DWQ04_12150 [Chloroflexota bacterium]